MDSHLILLSSHLCLSTTLLSQGLPLGEEFNSGELGSSIEIDVTKKGIMTRIHVVGGYSTCGGFTTRITVPFLLRLKGTDPRLSSLL